jgi:hypothetical protein
MIIFISFCSLVTIKFYVQGLKEQTSTLEKIKLEEENQIKVLRAEWAYLNKSDRLKYLANKYLALNEAKNSKIEVIGNKTEGKIHLAANEGEEAVGAIFQRQTPNWRYKNRGRILANAGSKKTKNKNEVTIQKETGVK